MPTRQRNPVLDSAITTPPAGRFIQMGVLAIIAFGLIACSGGHGTPGPPTVGTVIVRVTDRAGTPVRGAAVSLSAGVNASDPTTDEYGEVVFKDTLAGEREARAAKHGVLTATQRFVVGVGSVTRVNLVLDLRPRLDSTR